MVRSPIRGGKVPRNMEMYTVYWIYIYIYMYIYIYVYIYIYMSCVYIYIYILYVYIYICRARTLNMACVSATDTMRDEWHKTKTFTIFQTLGILPSTHHIWGFDGWATSQKKSIDGGSQVS